MKGKAMKKQPAKPDIAWACYVDGELQRQSVRKLKYECEDWVDYWHRTESNDVEVVRVEIRREPLERSEAC